MLEIFTQKPTFLFLQIRRTGSPSSWRLFIYLFIFCRAKLKYENPNLLLREIQAYRHNNFEKCQGDPVINRNFDLII